MDPSSRRVGIESKRRKRVVLENRSVWGRPALEGQCVSVRGREDSVHPHGLSEGNKTIPHAREGFSYDDLEPALLEHSLSQPLSPAQAFPGLCLGAQHPLCPAQPRRQPAPHRLAVRQGGAHACVSSAACASGTSRASRPRHPRSVLHVGRVKLIPVTWSKPLTT